MKTKHKNRWDKRAFRGALSSIALAVASVNAGQAQTNNPLVDLSVSAIPLEEALLLLSDAYDISIFSDENLIEGKRAFPTDGSLSVQEALDAVLEGSGLKAIPSQGGGYVLVLQSTEQKTEEKGSRYRADTLDGLTPLATETIIVRGQRVERTLFETPTSVALFTPQELDDIPGAQTLDDLLLRVPNILESGVGDAGVIIRGVTSTGVLRGASAATGGARPRASTLIDGRVQSFQEYASGGSSLYDIEQIEVYRGPQTIAQGVNAIAGALFIFTKDPTYDFEVGALAEVAENDARQFAGFVSGPIVEDQLAFRLTADYRRRDSFINYDPDTVVGPGSSIDANEDPTDFEQLVVRGKVLWEPEALPGFIAKGTLSYVENEAPGNEFVVQPLQERQARDFSTTVQVQGETFFGILDLEYDFGNGIQLSNQTSISDYEIIRAGPTVPEGSFDGDQITNETILRVEANQHLKGLAGIYYLSQNQTDLFGFFANSTFDDEQDNLGIFGRLIWQASDRIEITSGLRYQRDSQVRQGALIFGPFNTSVDYDESFDALLPKFELAYSINDAIRIGFSAARGFNPGGLTVNFFNGVETRFNEETVWTFDAFARTRLLDGALQFDANVFFSDFDGFQKTAVVGFSPADETPIIQIDNVDNARTYGLELSADYAATDFIRVFGTLGILQSSFDELTSPGVIEEFEFSNAPGFSALIGVNVEPIEGLNLNAQFRHTDNYFSDDGNSPDLVNESFSVLDLSVRYDFSNVSVYAFWENVTDEFYTTTQFLQGMNLRAAVGAPSRIGGGVEVLF